MPAECCKEFFNKIPDDEPTFTIAGRDKIALHVIKAWIDAAKKCGVNKEKIASATRHYNAVAAFQTRYPERVKTPD